VPLFRRVTLEALPLAFPLILGTFTACRDTPLAFGPTAATAHTNAADLFTALQERFTDVQRTPKFAAARSALARAALTPSRIYNDTTVWTTMTPDGQRALVLAGTFADNHYRFSAHPSVPPPQHLGDARHEMRLTRVDRDQYEWNTSVSNALGAITADDIAHVLASMLSTAATNTPDNIRAGYQTTFPATTAVLSRLFSLDVIRITPLGDSTSAVTLGISLHPDRLAARHPAYAAYIEKYVSPARARLTLMDHAGTVWWTMQGIKNTLTVTFRATYDGHLAPLTGPARPLPDSLTLRSDLHVKIWIFGVTINNLLSQFTVLHPRTSAAGSWYSNASPSGTSPSPPIAS